MIIIFQFMDWLYTIQDILVREDYPVNSRTHSPGSMRAERIANLET